MASGIYSITHIETGKIYIGQSIDLDRRINAHKNWFENPVRNINRYLYNYAKKYELSAFGFTIIEECCADDLDAREMHWYDVYKENTFNVRPSPVMNRGIKRSEEFCKENSDRQKKRMADPEKLEKHRAAMKKRSQSEDWLKKMQKITDDRVKNKDWLKKNQKMTSSKEVNDKRRVTNFINGHSKAVACYTKDNYLYDYYINVNEAVDSISGRRSNIVSCLQERLATSSGFKWKYLTSDEYLQFNNGEILKIIKT